MHGTFSHFGRPRPDHDVLTEDAMFHALQEVYPGQPVVVGGKPAIVQFVSRGLVWLAGFAKPLPLHLVEAC